MSSERSITLLHLSDPQFGAKHRFYGEAPDNLFSRLRDDVEFMRERHGLVPDLILVTGDLVETGKPAEFKQFQSFAAALTDYFALPRRRLVVIPGNHDVNRLACEGYFKECESEDRTPKLPYWPKLRHYSAMFTEFYAGEPALSFSEEAPYSSFTYPELGVVVAGLDSTIADSHRDADHYGFLGEQQLRHFAGELRAAADVGLLRIAAIHHHPIYPEGDSARQDLRDLKRFLGPHLNLVVHGHIHEDELTWLDNTIPVLGIGSAGVKIPQRPQEVPNQYQWIRVFADRIEYGSRAFVPDQKRWVGNLRPDRDGEHWWQRKSVAFDRVAALRSSSSAVVLASPEIELARSITSYRLSMQRQLRRRPLLCDLATLGEDSDLHEGLDLLAIFVPQRAIQEVPRSDRPDERDSVKPYTPADVARARELPPIPSYATSPAIHEVLVSQDLRQGGDSRLTTTTPYPRRRNILVSTESSPEPVDLVITSAKHPWIFLLGTPGAGKTTLTLWLALKLCTEGEQLAGLSDEYIPVRIELRLFAHRWTAAVSSGRSYDFFDFLDAIHREEFRPLRGDSLRLLADQGRLLWLFDGLDEVADSKRRRTIADMIVGVRERFGGRGIITGRIVGCRPLQPLFHEANIHWFTLLDLSEDQIAQFLHRWHNLAFPGAGSIAAHRHERLRQTLDSNPAVRDLCGNPLLLTLIALLNRGDELPRARHELYKRATDLMLGQWEVNNKALPASQATPFTPRDKRRYLAELAWHMVAELPGGAGNAIGVGHLEKFTTSFCVRYYGIDATTAGDTARILIEHLRERNYVLGLLGGQVFGFLHKAFLEYLTAEEILHRFRSHQWQPSDMEGLFRAHWQEDSWLEPLTLTSGLLQDDRPSLIVDLLRSILWETNILDDIVLEFAAFAVRCLAEGQMLQTGITRAFAVGLSHYLWCYYRVPLWGPRGSNRLLANAFSHASGRWPRLLYSRCSNHSFRDPQRESCFDRLLGGVDTVVSVPVVQTSSCGWIMQFHELKTKTPDQLRDGIALERILEMRILSAFALSERSHLYSFTKGPSADLARVLLDYLDSRERLLRLGRIRHGIVYWSGICVGKIEELSGGRTRFVYDLEYLSQPNARMIAPSLPLRSEPYDIPGIHSVFEGLFPRGFFLDVDLEQPKPNSNDPVSPPSTGSDTIGTIEIVPVEL